MAIRMTDELTPGDLFTTTGDDVYELQWIMPGPGFGLRNLRTGQEQSFGQGGITAEAFKPIPAGDPEWIMKATFQRVDLHISNAERMMRLADRGRRHTDGQLRKKAMEEIDQARHWMNKTRRDLEALKTSLAKPGE